MTSQASPMSAEYCRSNVVDINEPQAQPTIRECVSRSMQDYLKQLDGQDASDVYNMVLAEVEEPLLQAIMHYTRKNQTRAAEMLGLNRGTLRKKLKQYNML